MRSFTTQSGAHDSKPIVSKYSYDVKSAAQRVAGGSHPETGMPRNIWLHPQAVNPEATDLIEAGPV